MDKVIDNALWLALQKSSKLVIRGKLRMKGKLKPFPIADLDKHRSDSDG